MNFRNKRAIVTGAGKGIGRDIAILLASRGALVVAVSRTQSDLDSLHEETGCDIVCADLADADETVRAAEESFAFGPTDFLVNNAGISVPQSVLETDLESWDKTFAVNVRAAFVFAQAFARAAISSQRPGCAIVNVSSQASLVGLADHAAYCASKGALDSLTQVLAVELGPHGVRVNAVNPTVTLTPMGEMAWSDPAKSGPMLAKIPLGKFAVPRDVSHAVAYLLSDEAAMIHGALLPIDGGFLAT